MLLIILASIIMYRHIHTILNCLQLFPNRFKFLKPEKHQNLFHNNLLRTSQFHFNDHLVIIRQSNFENQCIIPIKSQATFLKLILAYRFVF